MSSSPPAETPPTVLIADDDPFIRQSLEDILTYEGYLCVGARDGKEALDLLDRTTVNCVLLDLQMPRISGMEVLQRILEKKPDLPVIIISGHGTIQLAVQATKMGAFDFLEKPPERERIVISVRNALERSSLKLERDRLLEASRDRYRMIGTVPSMRKVFSLIDRAARVDSKVLITGEPGTGKELVARAIHLNSARASYPFVPVNCSAIPESLIESELFGHARGAFTGAVADHSGKFKQADRGTLFLDEIGDMSLMMQAKVLRVIEDGIVEPIGGSQPVPVDVRIIAATNKDLRAEIANGNFRDDLFFRLNVIPIYLPPLRERQEDIQPLAEFFLEEICESEGLVRKSFSRNVWPILESYPWPGNVRELRNVVERAAVLSTDPIIDAPLITEALHSRSTPPVVEVSNQTLREARENFEREYILKTLASNDGRIQDTARALGIQRSHLWKKMKRYGIRK